MSTACQDVGHDLATEVAALRLIVRGIVAQMLLASTKPITESIKALEEAVSKMSPDMVPVADLDPELHRRAAELAQKRARALLDDIGLLVGKPRRRTAA